MSRAATRVVAVATAGLLLAGAAACGTNASSKPPKDELTTGIDGLGSSKALTFTLKIDATAAQLQQFATAMGDKLDPKVAALLAGADIKAQIKGDKALKDYKPNDSSAPPSFDLSGDLDGSPVVDLRTVDKVLYIRADVQKILTIAQKPQLMQELQARAATLPPFVQAAAAGKWVSFPADQAKALAGQLGASATATPNAEQSRKFLEQLKAIISRDVTVKRLSTGGEKGDHLQMSASTRALASDLMNAVTSFVPGSGALGSQLDPTKVQERTVTLDAYVKNGKLSEMSLDLAQFASGADAAKVQGQHLPVTMRFDDTASDISKPADATPIDLSQLLPLLGALSSPTATATGSGSATASP